MRGDDRYDCWNVTGRLNKLVARLWAISIPKSENIITH